MRKKMPDARKRAVMMATQMGRVLLSVRLNRQEFFLPDNPSTGLPLKKKKSAVFFLNLRIKYVR
jgi:hypothetical protein